MCPAPKLNKQDSEHIPEDPVCRAFGSKVLWGMHLYSSDHI